MQFSLPTYPGDWLPFAAAAITLFLGLLALFAPRTAMRLLRLDTAPSHPDAIAEIRSSVGGFWLGTGLVALLFYDQPFVLMALGAGWLFAGFGRLVSILSDSGATAANWSLLALNLLLAFLFLNPVIGLLGL